jgi:XTP/dITP diphosphohydrolase
MKLVLGTNNAGKVREILAILRPLNLTLLTLRDAGLEMDVHEDGTTYAENAAKKALEYARAANLPCLADDSGLEVDALGGAPGLHSARYSPKPGATDADRRAYLLENLRELPHPWTARFRATIAIALPHGVVECVEGTCEGEITAHERGTNGFGYDPLFVVAGGVRTMAELAEDEKNRISHRARALEKAVPVLKRLLGI